MKNFNQDIQVTVSVDSIAQLLLKNMNPEYKHAELVVESIIGRMLSTDMQGISRLYNALNGYDNKINFEVDEVVKVKDFRVYGYWTEESIEKSNSVYQNIDTAKIIDIDEHKDSPICIEFYVPKKDRTMERRTEWIRMNQASEIPVA